jgi:hypothetical protein
MMKRPASHQPSGQKKHFASRRKVTRQGAETFLRERLPWAAELLLPLQRLAVTPVTEMKYLTSLYQFHLWATSANITLRATSGLDHALSLYLQSAADAGADPSLGSYVLAATLHFFPQMGSKLQLAFPAASRCLAGWRRLCPPRTRPPLPMLAVIAIVVKLLASNEIAMAISILVGTRCYLRPCELTSLRRCQLVKPQIWGGCHFRFWTILLHPEGLKPSKTGYWDETIMMDEASGLAFLNPFFDVLTESNPQSCLWPFSHRRLVQAFATCSQELGLGQLQCCLYALRHAGASSDFLTGARSLLDIKSRGRWTSDASLRRYQKAAVAQRQLALMPEPVQQMAARAAESLETLFHRPDLAKKLLLEIRTPPDVPRT